MAFYESELSLKKMRVYRDSAELLFFVQQKESSRNDHDFQDESSSRLNRTPNVAIYCLPFENLSAKERSSLRILSPSLTLLHAEWTLSELCQAPSISNLSETNPVKPLSLPPPQRLENDQLHQKESSQTLWSELNETLSQSIQESLLRERKAQARKAPQSLDEIKRELEISETLNALHERWAQNKKKRETNSPTQSKALKRNKHEIELSIRDQECETLCVYIQDQQADTLYSPHLPKALSGAWIDSIPPGLITPELEPSEEEQINQKGFWVRLLLDSTYWTPSLVLSLHGDHGRLNMMATLQTNGIRQILQQLQVKESLQHAQHDQQEIAVEWINSPYYRKVSHVEGEVQTRESLIQVHKLLEVDEHSQAKAPSIFFESLNLMSRSLRDLEGKRLWCKVRKDLESTTQNMILVLRVLVISLILLVLNILLH